MPQLFIKRDGDSKIKMVMEMSKVTGFVLKSSLTTEIESFIHLIEKLFPISKAIVDEGIEFKGRYINQDKHGTIRLSMERYLGEINPIYLSMERRNHRL